MLNTNSSSCVLTSLQLLSELYLQRLTIIFIFDNIEKFGCIIYFIYQSYLLNYLD